MKIFENIISICKCVFTISSMSPFLNSKFQENKDLKRLATKRFPWNTGWVKKTQHEFFLLNSFENKLLAAKASPAVQIRFSILKSLIYHECVTEKRKRALNEVWTPCKKRKNFQKHVFWHQFRNKIKHFENRYVHQIIHSSMKIARLVTIWCVLQIPSRYLNLAARYMLHEQSFAQNKNV